MLFFLTVLLSVFSINLVAEPSSAQEIKVYLSTTSTFTPLYLGEWQREETTFNAAYLAELQHILSADFECDGSTKVMAHDVDKEERLCNSDKHVAFQTNAWREWGAAYVVIGKVIDHSLNVSLFSAQGQSLKHLPAFRLSGNLSVDRRTIHQISDVLHRCIYNKEGVAATRILYCVQKPNPSGSNQGKKWISEIWECDVDGANSRQVTYENSYCVTPTLIGSASHQENDRFIYVSYKMGQPKIYIASLKEGQGKRLVHLRGNQLLPAVSAQKDKIAFICDASGRTDLFVQHIDPQSGRVDKPVQLFSYPRSTQASPTFSPDGSKIAFVSDKDGGARIYTIPSQPSPRRATPQLLTKKNNENSCPAWSPDGKKLAYSAKCKGVRQIWIYDFASGEERQLTDGPGNKENPAWAPDSLHLVFNSTGGEQSELYVANLNQPEAIKITHGPGKKDYPSWGTR